MLKFTILGDPYGKVNMRPIRMGGHNSLFNPQSNVSYMNLVIDRVEQAIKENPSFQKKVKGTPVAITIIAFYKIPNSYYKFYKKENTTRLNREGQEMLGGKRFPTKKPDLDNISKVICDAVTKHGGVWDDDSQIVSSLLLKKYSELPRVEVLIEKWGGSEDV